jgi:hypothetical protein
MANPLWIDIHESAVASFIQNGGPVNDLMNDVAKDVKYYSVEYISRGGHIRSRRLLGGLYYNKTKNPTPLTGYSRAGSSAAHTLYFHEGTGHIFGRPFLLVPKKRSMTGSRTGSSGEGRDMFNAWVARGKRAGNRDFFRPESVRGQRAKPFLTIGLRYALAKRGLR